MIVRIRPGCYRFTSVLATTRRGWQRFDHVEEMPPSLRARCLAALGSPNSATVLIAGRSRPGPAAAAARPAPADDVPARIRLLRRMGVTAALFHVLAATLAAAWLFGSQL